MCQKISKKEERDLLATTKQKFLQLRIMITYLYKCTYLSLLENRAEGVQNLEAGPLNSF
jgi:hypothetical protein